MIVNILIIIYAYVCLMWGTFSVLMQKEIYPNDSSGTKLFFNFSINSLLCPISMLWALWKFDTYMADIKERAIWLSKDAYRHITLQEDKENENE